MKAFRTLSRRAIEGLIAAGDIIVIADSNVLRLNGWKDKHPGGELVLRHMIGRDATDEINMCVPTYYTPPFAGWPRMHSLASRGLMSDSCRSLLTYRFGSSHQPASIKNMHRYAIGRIVGPWENFIPPIQGGVFRPAEEEKTIVCSNASVPEHASSRDSMRIRAVDSGVDLSGLASDDLCRSDDCDVTPTTSQPANTMCSPETYIAGRIQHEIDADLDKYPSLDASTQHEIAVKFRALHKRIQDEGFYECRLSEYGKEMVRYTAIFATFVFFLNRGWYFVSACFLGLFWHQIMFTAHDAGHRGITSNLTADTLIGIFIADFCCGLSIGWWKSSHNVHHLVTNSPVSIRCDRSPRHTSADFIIVGTRSRHPERPSLLDITIILQFHQVHLLWWLHLSLGCCRCYHCICAEVHLLPCDGRCSVQPLHTLLGLPSVSSFPHQGPYMVDPANRDPGNKLLLCDLLLRPALAQHPDLASSGDLPAH